MPEIDAKAMKFVEDTLQNDPTIQLEELFRGAKKISPSIHHLSKRQFNARYPLQVKRRSAQAARAKKGQERKARPASRRKSSRQAAARPGAPRDDVRRLFLQFATDITAAEERKDLVKVLAAVDGYVEQVMKVTG